MGTVAVAQRCELGVESSEKSKEKEGFGRDYASFLLRGPRLLLFRDCTGGQRHNSNHPISSFCCLKHADCFVIFH